MAEHGHREHHLPIQLSELVELLVKDCGDDHDGARQFRALARMLSATFHYEFHETLQALKDDYAPFDPDGAAQPLRAPSPEERARKLEAFCARFQWLMERANFRHLDKAAIEEATKAVSDWGLNMHVDFNLFERLDVYYRGDSVGQRSRRRWWRFFRKETVVLPMFQRMILLVKLRPDKRWPKDVDTDDLFLKMFKDIPKMDVEMLLPGARFVMPGLSRLKMGGSFISGLGYLAYTIAKQIITAGFVLSVYFFWGPLFALLGYGYRQYAGYQTTKNAFTLQVTQSLYYQTLSNNLGVVQHLLDEAEEQECREALLAYFCLWRQAPAEGLAPRELDGKIEQELERLARLKAEFEIDDALAKLVRLKLVTQSDERYQALPVERALEQLDKDWDAFFGYSEAPGTLGSILPKP